MHETDFFTGLGHYPVSWGDRTACLPVFYPDFTSVDAVFLTPLKQVIARLPSRRMKPLRMTPWHAMTAISFFEYRDSDIGPYNEVAITFPFTFDQPAGIFFGALREVARGSMGYLLLLPVNTQIALEAGIEIANYPKFLADIEIERHEGWLSCRLVEKEQTVLMLRVRELATAPGGRGCSFPVTLRGGYLLRSELVVNNIAVGQSRDPRDVRLEWGDHPLALKLRGLRMGRLLQLQYVACGQAVLSQPLESYAA